MKRLTAAQAARVVGITPTSLHRWVRQGRITRHPDGYDVAELLAAEAARNHDALCIRAGIAFKDRPPRVARDVRAPGEIESTNDDAA